MKKSLLLFTMLTVVVVSSLFAAACSGSTKPPVGSVWELSNPVKLGDMPTTEVWCFHSDGDLYVLYTNTTSNGSPLLDGGMLVRSGTYSFSGNKLSIAGASGIPFEHKEDMLSIALPFGKKEFKKSTLTEKDVVKK